MAGSGRKWLIGCGVGCGAVVLLGIILSVGGGIYMMRPFTKAVDSQKALEAEFGGRETYIPPPGGLTSDRLETFIAVRRQMYPLCEEFQNIKDSFAAMDELDKQGEPSKGEIFKAVGGLTGSIFGMVGNIGRFTEVRNQALLDGGMSLGEYIWIYVLVYNSWQGQVPNRDLDGDPGQGMSLSEQKVVRKLVLNHTEALAAAGRAAEAALWEEEADRMKRTETGVPFKDTDLPEEIVRVFQPFAGDLESLYCEATSAFEMNRIRKKGLSIHSE
ncbi:MAG: hypothetical protein ABFS42_04715 [Candidatus Krumholzibacteriota bacterium]